MSNPQTDETPIPPVERMRQEVDRWLDVFRSTGERTLESLGLSSLSRPAPPPVDVIELPTEIIVQIDLPGVSAESVELSLVGNMLSVAATRVAREFPNEARVHVRERACGRFQRSVPLPAAVDDEAIRAETKDGLLTVTLRRAVPAPGRSIPVTRGNGT